MNTKLFSEAISEIDDKYYEEAANYKRKMINHGRRKWVLIAATIAALMLVGFTILPMIIEMINGRTVEWDDNHLYISGTVNNMAEVRDGRVYFTLDNSDITEYCSEETYFRYDFTDEQGITHVILVGGALDSIGWTEILFLEDGRKLSHSNLQTETGNDPEWYIKGNAEVNEDYGYTPPSSDFEHSYEYDVEVEEAEN